MDRSLPWNYVEPRESQRCQGCNELNPKSGWSEREPYYDDESNTLSWFCNDCARVCQYCGVDESKEVIGAVQWHDAKTCQDCWEIEP